MKEKIVITSAIGLAVLLGVATLIKKFRFKKNRLSATDVENFSLHDLVVKKTRFKDITAKITNDLVVFPGDPSFNKRTLCEVDKGCCFGLSEISMCNHMGTHIDFPSHVSREGKSSSDYSIEDFIGGGIIINVPENEKSITETFVRNQSILSNDFVFFKTSNSKISKCDSFTENFVYIEPDAAKALLELQVKVVGIDYLSVDSYQDDTLPVHKLLLSNDVLIVENLELGDIEPGRCNFFILPLNIPDMDGLPARVLISR